MDISCPFGVQPYKIKERLNCILQSISRVFNGFIWIKQAQNKRGKAILNITSSPHLLISNHLPKHFDYFSGLLPFLISNGIEQDHWRSLGIWILDWSLPMPTSNFLWPWGIDMSSLMPVNIHGERNNIYLLQIGVRTCKNSSEMWVLLNRQCGYNEIR